MKSRRVAFLIACASSTVSHALDSEQRRGKTLLQNLRSRCHAIAISWRKPAS
jgi:hypothetical protein